MIRRTQSTTPPQTHMHVGTRKCRSGTSHVRDRRGIENNVVSDQNRIHSIKQAVIQIHSNSESKN